MADTYAIQLGLYGGATVSDGTHVVSAHLRLLPTGGTTFVAEHVRWNRRRTASRAPTPQRAAPNAAPEAEQLTLWSR